jgi:hypothetical protein
MPSHRQHAFATIMIRLLILIFIKIEFICQAHTIDFPAAVTIRPIQHGKSDTIRHAHGPYTRSITSMSMDRISWHFLNFDFLMLLAIVVTGLIGGNFVQHGFQSIFRNMDLAFEFPFLVLPIVLVLRP